MGRENRPWMRGLKTFKSELSNVKNLPTSYYMNKQRQTVHRSEIYDKKGNRQTTIQAENTNRITNKQIYSQTIRQENCKKNIHD